MSNHKCRCLDSWLFLYFWNWFIKEFGDHLYLTTSTQTNNDIIFKPANTEAVRITGAGRLGVGTGSTVDQLFHIKDDSVANGLVRLRVQSGSTAGHADFGIHRVVMQEFLQIAPYPMQHLERHIISIRLEEQL